MAELLRFTMTVSAEDYSYYLRHVRLRRMFSYYLYTYGIVLFILVLFNISSFQAETPNVWLTILVDLVVVLSLFLPLWARNTDDAVRRHAKRAIYQAPFDVVFDERHILLQNAKQEVVVSYLDITRVSETDRYLFILYGKDDGIILKKMELSEANQKTMNTILQQRVNQKRLKFRSKK